MVGRGLRVRERSCASIAGIGAYSLEIRPSYGTTALALLMVMLRTKLRRPLTTRPRVVVGRGCGACGEFYPVPLLGHLLSLRDTSLAGAKLVATSWLGFVMLR